MAVLKCKMCGGTLNVTEGKKLIECDFCGTVQTIPGVEDEKKTRLFNRANALRLSSEFDSAAAVYENLIAEFPREAEAYWGLCLCKYGIEYVDDPGTAVKIPTCHRTSFESILKDKNYQTALSCSDPVAREIYEKEAAVIDGLQKIILNLVSQEKPYDIFICYKETDSSGNRTLDSILAQDLYETFTAKGYRVFFSKITLEDKLGQQYEPYIFAALNSARIMLAVGTSEENYQSVWVKNEWGRFLTLMKKDSRKILIPCFKDLDPYDLPGEFRHLQGQDLGKIGALQDLERGIRKILRPQTSNSTSDADDSRHAPSVIRNVCSIGSNDSNDLWPKGRYSSIINFDQYSVIFFHVYVDKEVLSSKISVSFNMTIYNQDNSKIFENEKVLDWKYNYDRLSKGWILKGSDGSFVPPGEYCAEFTVEHSQPFKYHFTVTSNEIEALKKKEEPVLSSRLHKLFSFFK